MWPQVTQELLDAYGGKLPELAWPGLYQILYVANGHEALCADCATTRFKAGDTEIVYDTFDEHNGPIACEDCGGDIEPDIDLDKEDES